MAASTPSAPVPLQDRFRPPLSVRRHWRAFHNAWATYLASDLNARLPEGYFAESNVQFGIEIDVAAFEEREDANAAPAGGGLVATALAWTAPPPVRTIPFTPAPETVEVVVYDTRQGPTLAGAVELISPANKDRPDHRDAFVSKCETYLHAGAGLAIVDVVTERHSNLHAELMARLSPVRDAATAGAPALYATAYRALERDGQGSLDVWHEPLAVGSLLPTLPLWLRGGLCVPVDLAATYQRTCVEQRLPVRAG